LKFVRGIAGGNVKRTSIVGLSLIILCLSSFPLFGQGARIRAYGSVGYTLAPPSLDSLDYATSIPWATNYKDATVGGGLQALFPIKGFDLGGDIGFTTLYSLALDNKAYLATNYYDSYYDASDLVNIDLVAEKKLGDLFFVQGGAGLYLNIWTYRWRNYYNNVLSDSSDDSGVGFPFGLMVAAGAEVPLSSKIKAFGLVRGDLIFTNGTVFPLRILLGIEIGL
jgi:hypothetical protein